ncbi:hypothetical protein BDP27DRAFT_1233 [Rhodocollybia butyracea]|uniref:Uncharacterized protein n=1 Tax=Rhodocollybia butyracea TaxID=206335 RepID=A0A9P5UGD4_9AGAR|nr:hypothetical protein BDP27DRAFT_1233 [Rhodocollybia butyracea]
MSLVRSANARLAFLRQCSQIDISFMKPVILDEETIKTPFLYSYLLLLSSIQMRRIMKSPITPVLFRHMHDSLNRSLATVQAIIRVSEPTELFGKPSVIAGVHQDLIRLSLDIVNEVQYEQSSLSALSDFDPKQDIYQSGADVYMNRIGSSLIHARVLFAEYAEFAALALPSTGPEVEVYELPGVMVTMKSIRTIVSMFDENLVVMDVLNEITNGWPYQE